jgi:hypothetical protein
MSNQIGPLHREYMGIAFSAGRPFHHSNTIGYTAAFRWQDVLFLFNLDGEVVYYRDNFISPVWINVPAFALIAQERDKKYMRYCDMFEKGRESNRERSDLDAIVPGRAVLQFMGKEFQYFIGNGMRATLDYDVSHTSNASTTKWSTPTIFPQHRR